jgi:threonine synthase
MWKAFDEMESLGWIGSHRPRMVTVQAAGCAPIVRAFHAGEERAALWDNAQAFALGLRVPGAVGDFLMLRALRASGGTAIAVPDDAIAAAGRDVARAEGLFMSPEGAATWAAARALREAGAIREGETVVLFNTGGWYKYAEGWRRALDL